jgi:hypothetical protein
VHVEPGLARDADERAALRVIDAADAGPGGADAAPPMAQQR